MSEYRDRPAWLARFGGRLGRAAALERYARLAPRYESTTTRIRKVRERELDLLALQSGETVFDIACGAGAIFRGLFWRLGPRGCVFGVEQTLEMAARAIEASGGCDNVRVLCEPVETFRPPTLGDSAAECYTHDVLQSPQALTNLSAQLRAGARVSVAGFYLLPAWGTPVNAWMLCGARHCLTTWRGLRALWVPLLDWRPDLRLAERHHWGTGYLAVGTVRSR